MKLFNYSRENKWNIDLPHVSIKIWTWCPAWCDCDFSYKKIKNEITYNIESLKKNIDFIDENFSDSFEIFLVWLNVLKYEKLFEILDIIISKWRKFKIQIPHFLTENDYLVLEKLSEKYWKFNCSIPKTIDSSLDISNLLLLIKNFSKINFSWKIYFDVFLDLEKYEKVIFSIIQKMSTIQSLNEYNCIIWDKFDIKFHDLSWKINHEKREISNLKRKSCLMKNYFYIDDKYIFLNDHIEILPNWDLTFHDNLCYLAHFAISEISKKDFEIIKDFEKYIKYLEKISDWDLVINCYKCLKNKYNYNKELHNYEY